MNTTATALQDHAGPAYVIRHGMRVWLSPSKAPIEALADIKAREADLSAYRQRLQAEAAAFRAYRSRGPEC